MIVSRAGRPRTLTLTFALAAALAALIALAPRGDAAPTRPLPNSAKFQDSAGEDPAAPDINELAISNDDKGNVTLVVNMPNRPTLTGDMLILVFFDTDANPATGDPQSLGADYAIELDGPLTGPAGIGLFRWDGTNFVATGVPQSSLVFSYANGAATIKINAADLGSSKRFNFAVIALAGLVLSPTGEPDFTNTHDDLAPDPGHGFFNYEVKTVAPALVISSFTTRPAAPRAGGSFTVSFAVARNDATPLQSATLACKATAGGHALKPSATSLIGSRASCTWTLPKKAKGQTIRGSVTVVSGSLKTTKTFAAKIR